MNTPWEIPVVKLWTVILELMEGKGKFVVSNERQMMKVASNVYSPNKKDCKMTITDFDTAFNEAWDQLVNGPQC